MNSIAVATRDERVSAENGIACILDSPGVAAHWRDFPAIFNANQQVSKSLVCLASAL
jgi:hypothetical protein